MLPISPIILHGDLAAFETDCACPVPPIASARATRYTGPFQMVPELYQSPLSDTWSLLSNTLAGGPPAVMNRAGVERLRTFDTPRPLSDAADRALAEARLIDAPGITYHAPTAQPDTLTAWVHVTNACNLECPYCYVRKSGAKMSLETGRTAIDALLHTARRNGFTALKLKYAGGEAALHYRMVQHLHTYACEQAECAGIALRAVVLSNGTVMPPAFVDWLASSGVRLMLSVDGVGADHDAQRPWKGGGAGAFAALERNLAERLLPRGIRPDICVTITGRNAHTAQGAVRWALGHRLPFSLNFYREHDHAAKHAELRYEEQQIIAGMLAAYAAIEADLPDYPILDGLLDRVQAQSHGHTCGVGRNYVVITHTGQVAQCQMALDQSQPFAADSDLIPLVAAGTIHNISVDEKEGCRDCAWRYRCSGGCPIVTLRATGRIDIKSPNCAIYRTLLPAALRVEGLRVLRRWEAQPLQA